nr:hypothetical protein [Ectobacillus panaciterrae]
MKKKRKIPSGGCGDRGVPYWTRESVEKFMEEKLIEKTLKE